MTSALSGLTTGNDTASVQTSVYAVPTLSISGAGTVNEVAAYTLNLSGTDPSPNVINNWTITWGDGSAPQTVMGDPSSVTHVFADGPNSYTISATATDNHGTYNASNTVAITVDNVAPTLTLSGAPSVNEGSTYTLGLASSDPGADTISQLDDHLGRWQRRQAVMGSPSSVTHVYADGPNNYTISATATDEDGTDNAGNTVAVTVNNVPPTLTLSGAATRE